VRVRADREGWGEKSTHVIPDLGFGRNWGAEEERIEKQEGETSKLTRALGVKMGTLGKQGKIDEKTSHMSQPASKKQYEKTLGKRRTGPTADRKRRVRDGAGGKETYTASAESAWSSDAGRGGEKRKKTKHWFGGIRSAFKKGKEKEKNDEARTLKDKKATFKKWRDKKDTSETAHD